MPQPLHRHKLPAAMATAATLAALATAAAVAAVAMHAPRAQAATPADAACRADSPATPPRVVELYTSEGCSSCPPADRWLSSLKGRADVLALAFHVDYWDRLGWPDRFASPAYTQRQYAVARRLGAAQVYTPQVLVDGADWRRWPALPAAPKGAAGAAPRLSLWRDGEVLRLRVDAAAAGTGARWAGYWAVLEDQHDSRVSAGENRGEHLRHDHVVRLLQPVAAWDVGAGLQAQLAVSRGVPAHPRRVAFVLLDAATQRPLQAVQLGPC